MDHRTFKFVEQVYERERSYFETELVGNEWRRLGERVWMPSYRRPLGAMVGAILNSGFVFVGLRSADPEEYERLSRVPGFLCLVGRKPGAA